jgi:hypothetical protein
VTTKPQEPLADEKVLPMLRFQTIRREPAPNMAAGRGDARKAGKRSLKIEGLHKTGFRAHMSAATLKRKLCRHDIDEDHAAIPRSHERGHIEATGSENSHTSTTGPIPRSHERGHIEAVRVLRAPLRKVQDSALT